MSKFWSSIVSKLTPYVPGEQPQAKSGRLIKLNTNENPYPPSPKVIETIQATAAIALQRYPDPDGSKLKKKIANYHSLETNQVFVGNSSDEVLAHAFQALLKQELPLCFPDITYGFYPVYSELFSIEYTKIPLSDDFSIALDSYPEKNGGIIFANPNAPTGLALTLDQIKAFLEKSKDSVVVVDEAYVDFGAESAIELINQYDNLLVTQTLSKSRSLAGLRVGFACGNAKLIEALERVKNSFNAYPLDQLAIAGACASFDDEAYFTAKRDQVIATRESAAKKLSDLGFSLIPSKANFLFAKPPVGVNTEFLFKELRERDVIVRYFDKPRISEYLRITIGTEQDMQALYSAVEEILS